MPKQLIHLNDEEKAKIKRILAAIKKATEIYYGESKVYIFELESDSALEDSVLYTYDPALLFNYAGFTRFANKISFESLVNSTISGNVITFSCGLKSIKLFVSVNLEI